MASSSVEGRKRAIYWMIFARRASECSAIGGSQLASTVPSWVSRAQQVTGWLQPPFLRGEGLKGAEVGALVLSNLFIASICMAWSPYNLQLLVPSYPFLLSIATMPLVSTISPISSLARCVWCIYSHSTRSLPALSRLDRRGQEPQEPAIGDVQSALPGHPGFAFKLAAASFNVQHEGGSAQVD